MLTFTFINSVSTIDECVICRSVVFNVNDVVSRDVVSVLTLEHLGLEAVSRRFFWNVSSRLSLEG